jgi:hypothetical protein
MPEDTPRRPDDTAPEPDVEKDVPKRRTRPAPARKDGPGNHDRLDQHKNEPHNLVPPRLDGNGDGDSDDL